MDTRKFYVDIFQRDYIMIRLLLFLSAVCIMLNWDYQINLEIACHFSLCNNFIKVMENILRDKYISRWMIRIFQIIYKTQDCKNTFSFLHSSLHCHIFASYTKIFLSGYCSYLILLYYSYDLHFMVFLLLLHSPLATMHVCECWNSCWKHFSKAVAGISRTASFVAVTIFSADWNLRPLAGKEKELSWCKIRWV